MRLDPDSEARLFKWGLFYHANGPDAGDYQLSCPRRTQAKRSGHQSRGACDNRVLDPLWTDGLDAIVFIQD